MGHPLRSEPADPDRAEAKAYAAELSGNRRRPAAWPPARRWEVDDLWPREIVVRGREPGLEQVVISFFASNTETI
jgi:hypothetical protein